MKTIKWPGKGCALITILLVVISQPVSAHVFSGPVTRVIDGDTLRISKQSNHIRIWGIDARELSQTGGNAAKQRMTELVMDQMLECRIRDTDKYGRIVAQCFTKDGKDIAQIMIDEGHAVEYCFFTQGYYNTCNKN